MKRKIIEEVLKMADEKRELLDRITKAKKRLIGHIICGDGLLKEIIEGIIDGIRTEEKYWNAK